MKLLVAVIAVLAIIGSVRGIRVLLDVNSDVHRMSAKLKTGTGELTLDESMLFENLKEAALEKPDYTMNYFNKIIFFMGW